MSPQQSTNRSSTTERAPHHTSGFVSGDFTANANMASGEPHGSLASSSDAALSHAIIPHVDTALTINSLMIDSSILSSKPSIKGSFYDPRNSSADDGKASLSSSTINLINSVLGTGLLALPRAFAHA